MNTTPRTSSRWIALAGTLTLAASLAACSGLTPRQQNTAIGAGVGAVGGSVLTGGSTLGTLGGAAVGGIIGNQVEPKK